MDLEQILKHLLAAHEFADNLEVMRQSIKLLNLSPTFPIILVGGTNGKGSTCAYLTTCLTLGGYRVGTFTSPHIFRYNERICINNREIEDKDLAKILGNVINSCPENLGLFKTFTLAAVLYFTQQKVDIAIIEVGIGGLKDATNLFEPAISAITTVDYDHCTTLGNTLEEIGQQKSGIFRPQKPALIGMKHPPQSIIDYANAINAKLQISGTNFGYTRHELSFDAWCNENKYFSLPLPALRGTEQLDNATLAIAILNNLRPEFPLSLSSIKTAMLQNSLKGRLSILPGQPQIIIDVAHNPQAVSSMLKNMLKLPFAKHNYAVFGVAADKDIQAIIQLAKPHFTKWFIAPINSARSIKNEELMQLMQDLGINQDQIITFDKINMALKAAKGISTNDDRIMCFGSFLVVEEAYKCN
jgi:dihydrofolate synthase/folylpolyglutamate synthase